MLGTGLGPQDEWRAGYLGPRVGGRWFQSATSSIKKNQLRVDVSKKSELVSGVRWCGHEASSTQLPHAGHPVPALRSATRASHLCEQVMQSHQTF